MSLPRRTLNRFGGQVSAGESNIGCSRCDCGCQSGIVVSRHATHRALFSIGLGARLAEKDKKLQTSKPTGQASEEARTWADEREASFEAQLAARNGLIREQAEKLAQLQQELDEAHARNTEAAQRIEFLERVSAEMLAVLESINRSLAGKLLTRYRRFRERLLPLGTLRRHLYDQWIIQLRNSPLSVTIRSTAQPSAQRHEEFNASTCTQGASPSLNEDPGSVE